jgi:lipoprotein-releasing system permease protein
MSRIVFFVALRQLWDRRLLNGIAVLGVVLGVTTLIAVRGMMNGFQIKFLANILKISPHVTIVDDELGRAPPLLTRYAGGVVVADVKHQSPSDRQLSIRRPVEIVRALERVDGVRAASASLVGSAVLAFGSKLHPVEVRGIEPVRQERVTPIAEYAISGSFRGLEGSNDGIVLGLGVANRVGAKVDDMVLIGSSVGQKRSLKVVGIFDASIPPVDQSRVYVTLKTAQTLLGKPDAVGQIDVRLSDPERAPAVTAELERTFGYDAVSWQEQNANFLAMARQQNTIVAFVMAAILAVGAFGILAVQFMIVFQKTRDIAILRSVGFRRRDILGGFLLQGAVVGLLGGLLGDLSGHYVLQALAKIRAPVEGTIRTEYLVMHDDPTMYFWGLGFALFSALIASLVPATRGASVEPVDVLRGQLG